MSRHGIRAGMLLAVAASLAGCAGLAGGSAMPPGPSTSPMTTASGAASARVTIATPPASPSAPRLPASPPDAMLAGLPDASAVAGALGTYTWDGSGSDAPWVVPSTARPAAAAQPLAVSFEGVVPESWTAAWAPVSDGTPGRPASGGSGSGTVTVSTPPTPGDWSLRVTAVFGTGANATYYWRLAVAP